MRFRDTPGTAYITIEEAARILGRSVGRTKNFVKEGKLAPARKLGTSNLFTVAAVEALAAKLDDDYVTVATWSGELCYFDGRRVTGVQRIDTRYSRLETGSSEQVVGNTTRLYFNPKV